MFLRLFAMITVLAATYFGQMPPIEPGVSHELAKWRAARYSDVRYKLNLTLEKMSPVLKGTMEIQVRLSEPPALAGGTNLGQNRASIILDWRRIRGSEILSAVSNVTVNGVSVSASAPSANAGGSDKNAAAYEELNEHLIFRDAVVLGENAIKLDFTSPILTSGSAITRYVDKEDGAEYIYSLFVPSDASTAFPVFDQPDLKARFTLDVRTENGWNVISNGEPGRYKYECIAGEFCGAGHRFGETKPIGTYVFAFAAGSFERVSEPPALAGGTNAAANSTSGAIAQRPIDAMPVPPTYAGGSDSARPLERGSAPPAVAGGLTLRTANAMEPKNVAFTLGSTNASLQPPATEGGTHPPAAPPIAVYLRKSQSAKFKPHAAEVFRLNREGIQYLEQYFDYKFPFPKYDIVLIPEFPFGGMEHAGATFLRESSVIFPQEPTKNDYISRANLIFHEAAHQWFGDTVTMKWFDDLWLKEGFAEFMAYKTLEKVMPEVNAWKVFYERNKQAAYLTDSTKGTTPIYQEIANLNSAKSAYGNIVYRKAPSFLKQAEFYIGPDKFQTAVRAFLKKYEFGNAGWEDLVKEFETASEQKLGDWSKSWITQRGVPIVRSQTVGNGGCLTQYGSGTEKNTWGMKVQTVINNGSADGGFRIRDMTLSPALPKNRPETPVEKIFGVPEGICVASSHDSDAILFFPNYQDHGYGIFLLDAKSRDYVLKNIGHEKDDFLRTMMWGSLWDSVREGELDPREYVELVVTNLSKSDAFTRSSAAKKTPEGVTLTGETDESTIQTLLGRVSTAMRYYIDGPAAAGSVPPAIAGGLTRPTTKTVLSKKPNTGRQPPATAGGTDPLATRVESLLIDRMQNASTPGQRITYYRAFLNIASSENARRIMKEILKKSAAPAIAVRTLSEPPASAGGTKPPTKTLPLTPRSNNPSVVPPADAGGSGKTLASRTDPAMSVTTKDKFDIVARLIILGDPEASKLLTDLEKTETSDEAKRYAYAAKAGFATPENKAKFWNDFVNNKDISESWIEAAFVNFNNTRHSELTLPYLEKALAELPSLKRSRKIFFVNGWLGAFIGGQKSEQALGIVNKFLADNPNLDKDLRLKILENADIIERAVKIRGKFTPSVAEARTK